MKSGADTQIIHALHVEPPNRARRGGLRRAIAAILVGAMSMRGCADTPDGSASLPPPGHDAEVSPDSAGRLIVRTEIGGVQYALELVKVGDAYRGERTVIQADGRMLREQVTLSDADIAGFTSIDSSTNSTLANLRVTREVAAGTGTSYLLTNDDGLELLVEVNTQRRDKVIQAAVVVLGVAGICGAVVLYSIKRCADANRCWSWSIGFNPLSICSGSCQNC